MRETTTSEEEKETTSERLRQHYTSERLRQPVRTSMNETGVKRRWRKSRVSGITGE